MSIVTLVSASAAPGVTTTALGLSLEWPRDSLLADVNRDPDDTVLAGFLAGRSSEPRGLASLVHAHREGRSLEDELTAATIPLVAERSPERLFLPGFSHPAGSELFTPAWPGLMVALKAMSRSGTDVIVDAGRIGRRGIVPEILAGSDALLVCTGSSLRALAGLRLYLPKVQRDAQESRTRLGLVLIGADRPYSAGEIAAQFGAPVVVTVAHDRAAAATLSDGAPMPRKFATSTYRGSLISAATRISTDLDAYQRPGSESLI